MSELRASGAPEKDSDPEVVKQAGCVLYILADYAEQQMGRIAPTACPKGGECGIVAKNDDDNLTHVMRPGACHNTSDSLYRQETMLPLLELLGF